MVGTFELCNLRESAEPPLEIRRAEGITTDPMVDSRFSRLHQTVALLELLLLERRDWRSPIEVSGVMGRISPCDMEWW